MMADCGKLESLLGPYMDGELSNEEAATVQRHLEECPSCAQKVELIQALGDEVRQAAREATDAVSFEGVWENIEARLPAGDAARARQKKENTEPAPRGWLIPALANFANRLKAAPTRSKAVAIPALAVGVALLVVLTLNLYRPGIFSPGGPAPPPEIHLTMVDDCLVNSIESMGGTTMIHKDREAQTTVLWLFQEPAPSTGGGETDKGGAHNQDQDQAQEQDQDPKKVREEEGDGDGGLEARDQEAADAGAADSGGEGDHNPQEHPDGEQDTLPGQDNNSELIEQFNNGAAPMEYQL